MTETIKTEELKERVVEAADALAGELAGLSDRFASEPETAFEERRTSAAMAEYLREKGFEVETCSGGLDTAFTARSGAGGPGVALLAEMDALPDIGHGCGHNIGGVASLGAGAVLREVLDGVLPPGSGTLFVFGTPGEEGGRGKAKMLSAGAFDGVDAAMMVHASSARTVVKHFLGLVQLRFVFHGRASHAAAYPEKGVNALDGVIQTFNSVNALRQQLPPEARVHGIITDGGRAPNIIPERAEAFFYVRAPELDLLEELTEKVTACAEGAATATGCTLDAVAKDSSTAPLKLNAPFADTYRRALEYLGLPEDPKPPWKNVGSSDIGDLSQAVPVIHPHVPIRGGLKIHTREFAEATMSPDGHRAMVEGVKCLSLTALELFFAPGVLEEIKREFTGA